MTVWVDFNMREEDGRVPALLEGLEAIRVGSRVTAADGEGTACQAVVTEIIRSGSIAMLSPVEGTWDRNSELRMPSPTA